jgi:hypothetical protein
MASHKRANGPCQRSAEDAFQVHPNEQLDGAVGPDTVWFVVRRRFGGRRSGLGLFHCRPLPGVGARKRLPLAILGSPDSGLLRMFPLKDVRNDKGKTLGPGRDPTRPRDRATSLATAARDRGLAPLSDQLPNLKLILFVETDLNPIEAVEKACQKAPTCPTG